MANIASFPTPGQQYKVKYGDWISRIANMAYGDATKWPRIKAANIGLVKSSLINGVVQEYFMPGDIIFIPELEERKRAKREQREKQLANKKKEDFTLIIENREITVDSIRAIRTMDTAADGWSCSFAWEPGLDTEIDKITAPYSYSRASVYIGGELIIDGFLYDVTHRKSATGITKELAGFSFTADIIDSDVRAPYEKNNITLLQRIREQVEPFGIEVIVGEDVDTGGQFKRVTADKEDKIFDHIAKLASQRGVLLSSTETGDLLVTMANIGVEPVGTITEVNPIAGEYEFKFSGRDRFNSYKAFSQTPRKKATSAVVKDPVVPRSRSMAFTAPDTTAGEITRAAEWKRNKIIAEGLKIDLPVTDWYDPNGNRWKENTNVSVVSAMIGIEKSFTFLINKVEYILDSGGRTAVLSLVPPTVYSNGEVEEPWLEQ